MFTSFALTYFGQKFSSAEARHRQRQRTRLLQLPFIIILIASRLSEL